MALEDRFTEDLYWSDENSPERVWALEGAQHDVADACRVHVMECDSEDIDEDELHALIENEREYVCAMLDCAHEIEPREIGTVEQIIADARHHMRCDKDAAALRMHARAAIRRRQASCEPGGAA